MAHLLAPGILGIRQILAALVVGQQPTQAFGEGREGLGAIKPKAVGTRKETGLDPLSQQQEHGPLTRNDPFVPERFPKVGYLNLQIRGGYARVVQWVLNAVQGHQAQAGLNMLTKMIPLRLEVALESCLAAIGALIENRGGQRHGGREEHGGWDGKVAGWSERRAISA